MRHMAVLLLCAASMCLFTGCGTRVSSVWRDDAYQRFEATLIAGAERCAPEETDNIRSTLALADRYVRQDLHEDADHLYQLSSQKAQLLHRSLAPRSSASETRLSTGVVYACQSDQEAFSESGVPLDETAQAEGSQPVAVDPAPLAAEAGNDPAPLVPRARTFGVRVSGRRSSPDVTLSRGGPRQNNPERTTIYLTFDDGPSKVTMPIAALLSSQGVSATFFVLGSNVKGHEKTIRSTLALGHRIGSHTLTHNLQKLNASFDSEANEVKRTRDLIEPLGGDGRMVRIPYGASTRRLATHVAAEGAQIFDWDINSNDSTGRGVRDHRYIERNVLRQLMQTDKRHVVILFHDGAGHESTLAALRSLLPRLKELGYRFGTLAPSERVVKSHEKIQRVQ